MNGAAPVATRYPFGARYKQIADQSELSFVSLGGDPAAPSGTATLLRLSASYQAYPRHLPPRQVGVGTATSGTPDFHRLTGGVYKARERIHRVIADTRLLAIPPSWSRVADSNPNWEWLSRSAPTCVVASLCTIHCSTCAAPDIRAMMT